MLPSTQKSDGSYFLQMFCKFPFAFRLCLPEQKTERINGKLGCLAKAAELDQLIDLKVLEQKLLDHLSLRD